MKGGREGRGREILSYNEGNERGKGRNESRSGDGAKKTGGGGR